MADSNSVVGPVAQTRIFVRVGLDGRIVVKHQNPPGMKFLRQKEYDQHSFIYIKRQAIWKI